MRIPPVATPPCAGVKAGTPKARRTPIAKIISTTADFPTSCIKSSFRIVFNAFACKPTIGYLGLKGIGFKSCVPVAVKP